MAEAHDERRLLAIMFTDVVGYTALTERDEAAAVRVRERHRELVQTLVKQFDGELVDATGDESLSIFSSAVLAVDCALALQAALRDDRELAIRAGIHVGDVVRRGGEVVGEGVNVAARIRPLAEPRGICVSEPVYQLVRSRAHIRARSLGAQTLRNVSLPVRVYALAPANARERGRSRRSWLVALGTLLALAALGWMNRTEIGAWLALNVPRVISRPLAQQIGFATTSDGVRVAYATSGAGPPLVLAVGWLTHLTEGLNSPLYDSSGSLRWYSRDHLVVRYDGRGFGLSDRNVTDFSLDARVRDLEAVVDALRLERFALCGISAGGPTVVRYVERHPERVSRLILLATSVGRPPPDVIAKYRSRYEQMWRMFDFARTSWDHPAARAAVVEWLAPNSSAVEHRVMMELFRQSGDGEAIWQFSRATEDATESARRLHIPTLVVAGTADSAMPVEASRAAAAAIPGARFEVLEGADHVQAGGSDPRLMPMLSDFLAEAPASP